MNRKICGSSSSHRLVETGLRAMSYSGLQSYNQYYQNQTNNRANDSNYANNRQAANTSNLQQPSSTGQQYGQGSYSWPSQTQQTFGSLNQENQNYGGQSWKSGQAQQPAYDYAGQRNDYVPSVSSGTTNNYYGTTSQETAPAGTNALSSLAYASGLESAGMQNQNSVDRSSQSNTPVSANLHQNVISGQGRVSSPAQAQPQNVYHNYSRSGASNTYTDNRPQSSQHNLAASAAAALTGATKRQLNRHSQSLTNYQQQPASYPSTMGNPVSTGNSSTSTAAQKRPASPYTSSQGTTQSIPRQPTLPQTSSAPYGNQSSTEYGNSGTKESHRYASNNPRSQSQGISSPYQGHAGPTETASNTQPNNFSFVNNVPTSASNTQPNNFSSVNNVPTSASNVRGEPNSNSYSQADTPGAGMPDFIDPSKVYNPYHQEYERRKKEAAEMEASQRQNRQSAETRQSMSEQSDPTDLQQSEQVSGARKSKEPARNKDGSMRKPREKKARQSEPIPKPGTSNSIARQSLNPQAYGAQADPLEDEDEAEMRAMLEKIRKLKSKDPSMFQKMLATMDDGNGSNEAAPAKSLQNKRASMPAHIKPDSKAAPPRHSMPSESSSVAPTPVSAHSKTNTVAPPFATTHINPNKIGSKVVVENNEENLPDLGRFPAERRQRGPSKKKDSRSGSSDRLPSNQPTAVPSEQLQFPVTTTNSSHTHPPPAANFSAKLPSNGVAPMAKPAAKSVAATRPTSSGSTIWPEAKRKSLAEAAVKVLNAHPGNQGKQLSPEVILALLDLNPSYIQLCEHLESKGLCLHRGHFARSLLSNVPDLASPNQPQSQSQRAQGQAQMVSLASPDQPHVSAPVGTKPINQELSVKEESKGTNKPGPKPKPRLGVPTPPVPKPVPGSKEAQARKRDFSELVDLTLLSDDENYVMPSKKAKTETPPPSTEDIQPDFAIQGSHTTQTEVVPSDPFAPLQFQTAAQPASNLSYMDKPQQQNHLFSSDKSFSLQHQQMGMRTQPPLPVMAKVIDRKEAMKKPFYESKTIARDILIAAGRHPTEKGLNSHLLALLSRLNLMWDCDFTTVDWDSVDPGGPHVPRVEVEDILAGPPKWALRQRAPFGGKELQSETEGPRQPIRKQRSANPAAGTKSLEDFSEPANPPSERPQGAVSSGSPNNLPNQARLIPDGASPSRQSSLQHPPSSMKPGAVYPSGKRRGRPPGARNKIPTKSHIRAQEKASGPVHINREERAPSPVKTHVYQCAMKGCGSELHNLATLRKHIRKHLTGDEHRGYECWWRRCPTHDRNNEGQVVHTVRFPTAEELYDHVQEDHIEPIAMRYGDGPSTVYSGKQESRASLDLSRFLFNPVNVNFPSGHEARTRLTDPQTVEANAARYLNNASDEVVTYTSSSKTVKDYASDTLILPVEKDPHRSFEKVHGNRDLNDVKSATEILRAMEARKAKIPGIERGGCILVTPERRKTLDQEDDFEGLYVDSDDD